MAPHSVIHDSNLYFILYSNNYESLWGLYDCSQYVTYANQFCQIRKSISNIFKIQEKHTQLHFIILLGIIPNGLWRKLIHWVWWVSQKLLMKICSPINNKTSAELSYIGQRVRLIPKATCNIKKIQYKGRQSAGY